MKIRSLSKKSITVFLVGGAALTLVAWSPTPAGDSVVMPSGNVRLSEGVVEVKPGTAANNFYSNNPVLPAVVVGDANRLNQTGTDAVATSGQGVVVGTGNSFGTIATSGIRSFGVTLGESNRSSVRSTLVVGFENLVSPNATISGDSVRFSGIFGSGNNLTYGGCVSVLVAGGANTVYADNSLVAGSENTVGGPTANPTKSYRSAAIGDKNLIAATHGWAMGKENNVFGDNAVAIGTGTKASNTQSTALGRYNSTMSPSDVLVIGTGTGLDETNRKTAFRVTSESNVVIGSPTTGIVVLAKAQGDISMGEYTD